MRPFAIAGLMVILLTVPVASADHIDDVGDKVTVDYVQEGEDDRIVCQRATPSWVAGYAHVTELVGLGGPGDLVDDLVPHPTHEVVYQSLCVKSTRDHTYRVTVESDEGTPTYRWFVRGDSYENCKGQEITTGSVEFTIDRPPEQSCGPITVEVQSSSPMTGEITVERIG